MLRSPFGFSRGFHLELYRSAVYSVENKLPAVGIGSCAEQVKKLRHVERSLQIARTHAVASGKKERVLMKTVSRLERAVEGAWKQFGRSCTR